MRVALSQSVAGTGQTGRWLPVRFEAAGAERGCLVGAAQLGGHWRWCWGALAAGAAGRAPRGGHPRRGAGGSRLAAAAAAAGAAAAHCVHTPVPGQLVLAVEAPPTEVARERPLARVDHGMARQVVLLREAFPTHLAPERLVTRVRPHVIQQLAPVAEAAATDVAGTGLLTMSCPHVSSDSLS